LGGVERTAITGEKYRKPVGSGAGGDSENSRISNGLQKEDMQNGTDQEELRAYKGHGNQVCL
jgi:hypothetical protein